MSDSSIDSPCTEPSLSYIKSNRRYIQSSAQILENRVSFLKNEDLRSYRQLEETRKRAREIMQIKARNFIKNQEKKLLDQEKENQAKEQQQRIREQRKSRLQLKEKAKEDFERKLLERVQEMQRIKQANRQIMVQQEVGSLSGKKQLASKIKHQRSNTINAKKQFMKDKQRKVSLDRSFQIYDERKNIKKLKQHIKLLEGVEMKLIKQLQYTQFKQNAASEKLQNIVEGKFDIEKYIKTRNKRRKSCI